MFEIPVRLRERLASQRFQLPDTPKRIFGVIPYQHIEEELPGRNAVLTEEFYGFMNIILHDATVVGHTQKTYPFDPCEQFRNLRRAGDTPGIESLVEIYPDAHADDLLDLHKSPLRSQDIVVEQYSTLMPVEEFFDVSVCPDFTFLMGHDAPRQWFTHPRVRNP